MSHRTTTIDEAELRQAHRELGEPITFEAIQRSPALVICLRNLAEIRKRRAFTAPAPTRAMSAATPMRPALASRGTAFDRKRAAANDRDDA